MKPTLVHKHRTTKHKNTGPWEVRPGAAFGNPFLRLTKAFVRATVLFRILIAVAILGSGLFCSGLAYSGCSDDEYAEALKIYEDALKAGSPSEKIELFERAFKICPSHGRFARGYYLLGKAFLDLGQKERAFEWLLQANRFRAVLLQKAMKDLAQTNLLLAQLHKENGDEEKALVHLNVYKALADLRSKRAGREFLDNLEDFYDVIYTPGTVKEVLAPDSNIPVEQRSKLMRLEILFDFDKFSLNNAARKRLDGIGKALQGDEFSGCTIVVEGHTDE
jgi:outer membrane protein OmpA-like peptidoglycan-associated protein